jgi:chemotaxis response regulator CheB
VARPVRIVVGEGRAAQKGLLRFVLEGEGFDVVGEARGTADLSEVIESNEPDVVVLDDGIGVIAVSMVHEVAPQAKVVLVWPSAVVPIGGDARVEPARILRDLGAAVTHVMAPAAALTETFERPGWVEKVRKDPTALREKLAGKETTKRPSVTRLQRRNKRLHPTRSRSAPAQPDRDEDERVPAPVVVLPSESEAPTSSLCSTSVAASWEPSPARRLSRNARSGTAGSARSR